jgi:choline-sulfatase
VIGRRAFLGSAAGAALGQQRRRKRPNVVMIMTDDHGAWTLGSYGCRQMHTPNIDALAAGGARFERAYACTPVCSPSRMTWITGRLPAAHTVQDWLVPDDSFGPKAVAWLDGHPTYSETLAKNGYTLGMCGKWHMGQDEQAQRGFTYWATVPGGGGPYKDVEFVKNGERVKTQGFKTDRVGDFALEFLDRQRGKEDPFYLLVPFYAPHTPFDYQPEEYRAHYDNSDFSCYPRGEGHPRINRGLRNHLNNQKSMQSYSALISGADANVGRIVRKLEEMGVRNDTLIVFTADQGYNAGQHGVWGKGNGTWPFNMYEESIRVPLIWNHPGRIKPGTTPRQMVSSYDYFPTILDYLGIAAPPDPHRVGRSYAPLLAGRSPRWNNRLYFEYSFVRGLRTENLKLIQRTKEWPSELYDLESDPGETRNRYDDPAFAKQRAALQADLDRFFQKAGAPDLESWNGKVRQNLTKYSN